MYEQKFLTVDFESIRLIYQQETYPTVTFLPHRSFQPNCPCNYFGPICKQRANGCQIKRILIRSKFQLSSVRHYKFTSLQVSIQNV